MSHTACLLASMSTVVSIVMLMVSPLVLGRGVPDRSGECQPVLGPELAYAVEAGGVQLSSRCRRAGMGGRIGAIVELTPIAVLGQWAAGAGAGSPGTGRYLGPCPGSRTSECSGP